MKGLRKNGNSINLQSYGIIYIAALCLFIWGFRVVFDVSDIVRTSEISENIEFKSSTMILFNNLKNFIGYIAIFPIAPILLTTDFVSMGVSIAISSYYHGVQKTVLLLGPHAIIEIPNFILYTWISLGMCSRFWREERMSIAKFVAIVKERIKLLRISIIVIVVAAFVEGWITPAVYKLMR